MPSISDQHLRWFETMTSQQPRRLGRFLLRRRVQGRVIMLRRFIRKLWERVFVCSIEKTGKYKVLTYSRSNSLVVGAAAIAATPPSPAHSGSGSEPGSPGSLDPDLVSLKISLLGDQGIGKTSFLAKYVGDEKFRKGSDIQRINQMDKTLMVRGARISYSIWEVQGDEKSYEELVPAACKDSVAVLFMFDLTSRCTLNSVISWYQQAMLWNQNAIPIIVGTKFDEFIQLPMEVQWTIASQARAYAKAINATIFFSSATYNINVNKIFKFITAKLFDLPWTVKRNLTLGEPIIDF